MKILTFKYGRTTHSSSNGFIVPHTASYSARQVNICHYNLSAIK